MTTEKTTPWWKQPVDTTSPVPIGSRVRLIGERALGTVARHEHAGDVHDVVVRFDYGYVGQYRRSDLTPAQEASV